MSKSKSFSVGRFYSSSHSRKALPFILSGIAFLIGITLFIWPSVQAYRAQLQSRERIAAALGPAAGADAAPTDSTTLTPQKRSKSDDAAYAYLLEYNEKVRTGRVSAANDPWSLDSESEQLSDVGLADGIVGSLSVPRMGIVTPIYLGATSQNMLKGSGVVFGTSAPLGHVDSNCVIAAHRGMLEGFRNIEDVQLGDILTIETPWDSLVYRAVEIKVIEPNDFDAVKVHSGHDMVTLLTCHPYGHNNHRYLVFFERVSNAGNVFTTTQIASAFDPILVLKQALTASSSPELVAERWIRAIGMLLIVTMLSALVANLVWRLIVRIVHR
ncbi:class C sortase [Atopobium fossor]|uniref:class C sortase n=1 Tax=Atopobium fossor TaxID=39487 RepID=UPI0006873E36|nr:class C sortase [Atopobium fossor]